MVFLPVCLIGESLSDLLSFKCKDILKRLFLGSQILNISLAVIDLRMDSSHEFLIIHQFVCKATYLKLNQLALQTV